ncbi:two-component system, OmpR family, response regulator YxdJ [Seinonella peptonophila]|uniref:Two-component system, OmpR family, response regulator YxdJ n=1 Tax=Seinonella peptonophila TaxID=112248 RepID=A0A1M4ZTN8_9BACL|nr:response regulator transcription factor [Seinonella peptonophila]SHF21197.1 two-component system, OmpR family, response regulator YxdJ [Seinonella peptonophila]
MSTLLIIEDDQHLAQHLQIYLHRYGYTTYLPEDFKDVICTFQEVQPDLVLLDVNLPYYDGFYWCRQIRFRSNCPILFISAREGTMDQVMALENGADDYITKPFDYDVVIAKIRSLLRRVYGSYAMPNQERTIECQGLILLIEQLELQWRTAKIGLNRKEALLLEALMNSPKRVVSRNYLLERLWKDQEFVDENTLNVYITRVRKKLGSIGLTNTIETVRGVGYRLKPNWSDFDETSPT